DFTTEHKADKSLVTSVDQQAEEVIIQALRKGSPHAILSEESGELPGSTGFRWVIDPIDGTTNFARHSTPFAVSIALMAGDDSMAGVIRNPLTGECYYAERGGGAFLDGRRIAVSGESSPQKSIVFYNFGANPLHRQRIVHVVERLIYEFDLRTWGTTAWELCAVAKGSADAFICIGDKIWDYAAGLCIIKEAGGEFIDWQGAVWNSSHSFILACQPAMKAAIIDKISPFQY
ncbi:hypothetical protein JW998_16930, partial [candidate division KSB1 bacterium]|nr:hypothetical protein [candidate division KSB1 bacterium]